MKTFADLGVDDDVVETLAERGINEPFPIQSLAIPLAIKGHDLIGQARTGTGKTIAFALPTPAPGRGRAGRRQAAGARRRPDPRAGQPGRP